MMPWDKRTRIIGLMGLVFGLIFLFCVLPWGIRTSEASTRTRAPSLTTSQGTASVWEAIRRLEQLFLNHTHDGTDGSTTLSLDSDLVIGNAISGGTADRVLIIDSSGNLGYDDDLPFDGDNLGIGITPDAPLDVLGGSEFSNTDGNSALTIKGTSDALRAVLYPIAAGLRFTGHSTLTLSVDDGSSHDIVTVSTNGADVAGAMDVTGNLTESDDRVFSGASMFESSEQSLPGADSTVAVAHGLGGVPRIVQVILRCKTTEHGYAVGDEANYQTYNGTYIHSSYWADGTYVTVAEDDGCIVWSTSTNNPEVVTAGNWRIVVRAWY